MSDTQRTRSALQTLLADNVIGAISPQDLRDFLVTVMQPEFVNENDFWNEPTPAQVTHQTTRGYHLYSQTAGGSISLSFGRIYNLTPSGVWSTASPSISTGNYMLGMAADSYASGATTVKILRKGIMCDSTLAHVNALTGYIGLPIYLCSATLNSYDAANADGWSRVIGRVIYESVGNVDGCHGKIRFDPDSWAVKGV